MDTCTYRKHKSPNIIDETRINFKVVICKAIEFFYRQCHTCGNDNAKIHTFCDVTKFILSI